MNTEAPPAEVKNSSHVAATREVKWFRFSNLGRLTILLNYNCDHSVFIKEATVRHEHCLVTVNSKNRPAL